MSILLALLGAFLLTPHRANASLRFAIRPPQALVLEPFEAELSDSVVGQDVADALQSAGFAVTVLQEQQVTVPIMLNLSRYAVIYISTHVGPLPNNDAAVATGDTRHKPFAAYLANYSLAEMRILAHDGVYRYFDAITGRFIHRYVGTFPAHTIVFLNSCTALDMPLFWKYLQESGVATLISWHHHVISTDADRAAEVMLPALATGESVSQALSTTEAAGAGTTLVKNQKGWFSFSGDGANTLQQAADSADPSSPNQ